MKKSVLIACIMILAALTIYTAIANAVAHPLCAYFAALAETAEIETAVWVGYPQGWHNYPGTWDYETYLPIGNEGILSRTIGDETWLWGYKSLDVWTDANGNYEGNHDFCEHVLIVRSS